MRLLPLLLLVVAVVFSSFQEDPYHTLGLKRNANLKDIKRAYKGLVREWHPDKNDDPQASEKFMQIQKAYDVLGDPVKKERYDKFGTMDEPQQRGGGHGHPFGGFDPFFGGFGGFGGRETGNSYFEKHRVSTRQYHHNIVERSHHQPFIFFAYSGYCQLCFRHENTWKSIVEDLEPLGYGIGSVNAMFDGNLLEQMRVTRLPSIVVVVEGRVIHYRGNMQQLSARDVRIFARDVLPDSFLLLLNNHDKLKRFVDMWRQSNKVSVLIMGASQRPRVRYLLTAMRYSSTARFAYVWLGGGGEVDEMRESLGIKCTQCENILLFNDFPESGPVARLSISNASQLKKEAIESLIEDNKFTTLPRLSSQLYLDELCPVSSRNPRRLCAVLIASDAIHNLDKINAFREFARREKALERDNMRLSYVFGEKQSAWLRPFLENRKGDGQEPRLDVVVFWRYEHVRARFVLLEGVWGDDASKTGPALQKQLRSILNNQIKLEETAKFDDDMVDELIPSWFVRFSRKTVRFIETLWFHLTKEEVYPVISVAATLLLILFSGYALNFLKNDGKRMKKEPRYGETEETWHPEDPKTKDEGKEKEASKRENRVQRVLSLMEPHIHELRAESYFGMIRLLKPGCRSLVVLVDEANKQRLIQQFAQYIFPLRNNKTFSFGYLVVEKNLGWFSRLLEHTLPGADGKTGGPAVQEQLKSINPKQTVGTVLVLCGWKLYFSIYHPMHTAGNKKHFLGFDDDGEEASDWESDGSQGEDGSKEEVQALRRGFTVNADNVLNGFPNWLDRLLEGSIRRYYIPEWPDNLK